MQRPPTPPKVGDHVERQHEAMRVIAVVFGLSIILLASFAGIRLQYDEPEVAQEDLALAEVTQLEMTEEEALHTLARFPDFTNFAVYVDPYQDQLWVKGYTTLFTLDNKTGAVEEYTDRVNPDGLGITSISRVGQDLLVGLRGGVVHYALGSGERTFLTEADGLPSESNIVINADPYNPGEVWIGTFQGLARYSLADKTLRTVSAGRGVQPRVFGIDAQSVWVTAGANAYYGGAVEKIDKNTLRRTIWTAADFVNGDTSPNGRLDPEGWAFNDATTLLIREDDAVYEYDGVRDAWEFRFAQEQGSANGIDRALAFEDGVLHAKVNDTFVGFAVADGSEVFRVPINVDGYTTSFRTDAQDGQRTFAIGTADAEDTKTLYEYLPFTKQYLTTAVLSVVSQSVPMHDVQVIDASEGEMIVRSAGVLHVYDIATGDVFSFPQTATEMEGYIVPDGYVVHAQTYCDGMGYVPECAQYRATTTFYTRDRVVTSVVVTPPTEASVLHLVREDDEFYLQGSVWNQDTQTHTDVLLQANKESGAYEASEHSLFAAKATYHDAKIPKRLEPAYGTTSVSYLTRQQGPYFEVQLGNGEVMISTVPILLPIDPDDGFTGGYPWFDVADPVAYGNELWFGTEYGIVVLDLDTRSTRYLGTADGLFNRHIDTLWFSGDYLVADHSPYAEDIVVYQLHQ